MPAAGRTQEHQFLNHKWRDRLKQGPITYILQLQLHEVSPSDPPEILNSLLPWDQGTHPFINLATVSITRELSYAEQCYVGVEITNHPSSMSILPSNSIDNFNSYELHAEAVDLDDSHASIHTASIWTTEQLTG